MRIAGIIAEYDPFHNGHSLLVQAVRWEGADAVVAVMGGNWLQRGGPALFPKEVRAKAAIQAGIDLVLELPLPYAAATAERFAWGGVSLLLALGCVDILAFGSECGELGRLEECAAALSDPRLDAEIRRRLGEGASYAVARQQGIGALLGPEAAALLSRPNDTLAVQYLRELAILAAPENRPRPFTILRQGADHDSLDPCPGEEGTVVSGVPTASASWLRERLRKGDREEVSSYLPTGSREVIFGAMETGQWADPALLELPMLAVLRRMEEKDFAVLPDLSEGLEHRLAAAVKTARTLPQLMDQVVTKRYPRSRIRRVLLSAYLGIPKEAAHTPPPYLRVLGMTPQGEKVLAKAKKTATLPISHSLAKLEKTGETAEKIAAMESRSTDLYGLLLRERRPCGTDYKNPVARAER